MSAKISDQPAGSSSPSGTRWLSWATRRRPTNRRRGKKTYAAPPSEPPGRRERPGGPADRVVTQCGEEIGGRCEEDEHEGGERAREREPADLAGRDVQRSRSERIPGRRDEPIRLRHVPEDLPQCRDD